VTTLSDHERYTRTEALLKRPTTVVTHPVWIGDDGWLRTGRGDTRQMLEDLGYRTSAQ